MLRTKKVDAVIFFDVNVPRPKSNNHVTVTDFMDALDFDARLVHMSGMLKYLGLPDKQVLRWMIYQIQMRRWHKKGLSPRYYFFVTKDLDFARDAEFNRIVSCELRNENAVIKIITVEPAKNRRNYKRRETLEIIIHELNREWSKISPI